MANEVESATICKVVDYLRKEAAKFNDVIKEGEDHGGDVTWAKVKRMSLNAMADRILRGDWKSEQDIISLTPTESSGFRVTCPRCEEELGILPGTCTPNDPAVDRLSHSAKQHRQECRAPIPIRHPR